MQKDKHNIYSKEELLKLIKEGKNAPADMDEFDLEALEGLKLLDNPSLLNKLDAEIDSIVTKEKKKKTIYYFSAAASLLLLIGLVFFFKNEFVTKDEKPIASAENLKKPEESTLSNTSSPTQPETQTTYEAKEPEAPNKKEVSIAAKKETLNSLAYQSSPAPVIPEEKMQEAGQASKDSDQQLETKGISAEKANNYEESKVASTQIKQEQQDVGTTETEVTSNNALYDGKTDNDKSKNKKTVVAGNTAQPAQMAFSKSKVAADVSSKDKNDEGVALQQSVSLGALYVNSPDKKAKTNSYKESAFIGGDTAFASYAKQHLKISSPTNSGIIVVEFLISKTGKAEKVKILKPLNNCDACSQDVIDLIKSVEKWSPAEVDGNNSPTYKKISIQYN